MKKNIYNILDEVTDKHVPNNFDAIMKEIKKISSDEPVNNTQTIPVEKKKRPVLRYSAISSVAACAVIVLSVMVAKQNLQNTSPSIDDFSLNANLSNETSSISDWTNQQSQPSLSADISQGETSTPSSKPTENEAEDPTKSQIQSGDYFNIPAFMVIDHRFYRTTSTQISESDLDRQFTKTVNGEVQAIYSLKGQSLEIGLVYKLGNVYRYYECIHSGVFTFNNRKYGLEEQKDSLEKGKYLGTADGLKLYEIVGNDKAILVDMSPIINLDGSECLYVAALLE